MSKVIVLGGCGVVGSNAVKTLVGQDTVSEIIIGDINLAKAKKLAAQLGKKVKAIKVDALSPKSIKSAIKGCDVVLNCTGPFYKFVKTVLQAVIESKINYVDVCDDVDVTLDIFKMDKAAKKAGVSAVIGMGSSPGATNMLAKFAANHLLDETDAIDIFHAHGGEPVEGEGVIGHRFHCMSIDIPMYLDGKLKYVKYFEPDGIALRESFTFPVIGKVLLYPYPHPEQVTLPKYIKCRQVTNKGSVIPEEYYNLTRDIAGLGLHSKEFVTVNGKKVLPHDFSIAFIIQQREKILKASKFGTQRGCASVIVKGKKAGKYSEYRFHMSSQSQALGEGTGIPAAMGVLLSLEGKVRGLGVMPPEACLAPTDFLAMLPRVMKLDKKKEGGKSFGGVAIEHIDEKGNVKKIDI